MTGHYLMLQVSHGKADDAFTRVYLPLLDIEETAEEAAERYIAAVVKANTNSKSRKKTIAAVRSNAIASIDLVRLCRPTSWHRENETGAFAPSGTDPTSRKRRRR